MGTLRDVGERWTVASLLRRFQEAPGFASPATWHDRFRSATVVQADPLGSLPVGRLNPVRMGVVVQRWQAAGLSSHQIRHRVVVIQAAVRWAVTADYLARDVLVGFRGVPHGWPRTHVPVPVVRQLATLGRLDLDQTRRERIQQPRSRSAAMRVFRAQQTMLAIGLVADVGLRRGELTGLRTDDLQGRELWVERAIKRAQFGLEVGPPKTYRPDWITVSAVTARNWAEYLHEWFGPTTLSGMDSQWLFSALPGGPRPLAPETLATRFAAVATKVRTQDQISLHRVRHTVATSLVAMGELDVARRRLRHSRLDTTLRHYTDTTDVNGRHAADDLEDLYATDPPGTPSTT